MPAPTRTVFPCYAAADRDMAASVAAFLAAGADVRVLLDEGEMRPDEDLVQKAREARMADIVLVFFSRHSLPSPWPRAKWEAALQTEPAAENVRIAFLRCDDCSPPRVLAPQFDLGGRQVAILRRLKRWIRLGTYTDPAIEHPELAKEVEALGVAIADKPGAATVEHALAAEEFRRVFHEDFDAVIRLECGGRSVAALAGDLAAQLGLRLESDLERNLADLRSFCSGRRFLMWLEGASACEAAQFSIGGRTSIMVSSEARREQPSDDESLRDIQRRFHGADADDWSEVCRLARVGVRLAAEQGRIAESFELLGKWHEWADERGDRRILEESAREMFWILEGWGRFEEARRLEFQRATQYADQMALDISVSAPPPPRLVLPAAALSAEAGKPERMTVPRPEQYRLF